MKSCNYTGHSSGFFIFPPKKGKFVFTINYHDPVCSSLSFRNLIMLYIYIYIFTCKSGSLTNTHYKHENQNLILN